MLPPIRRVTFTCPHTHKHLVTLCIARKEKDNSPIYFLLLVCFVVVVVACFLSTCLHLPKMNTKYKITYVFVFFLFFFGGEGFGLLRNLNSFYTSCLFIYTYIYFYTFGFCRCIYTHIYIYIRSIVVFCKLFV